MVSMIFSYYINDRTAMQALMDVVMNHIDSDLNDIIEARYQDIEIANVTRNKRAARALFIVLT